MKIIVFVKQVPDTDDVKLDPKTGNLCREGVKSMLNPLAANAVEAALRLREAHGGTVAAVTMGPPQAEEALKKALAMGCDEAYLLSDRAFGGADTLATSYVLSKAAEKIGGFDLLIFGRHAVDGDTAQTGPATAAFLDIPQVTLVSALEVEDGWARCERELGSVRQTVRVTLRQHKQAPLCYAHKYHARAQKAPYHLERRRPRLRHVKDRCPWLAFLHKESV